MGTISTYGVHQITGLQITFEKIKNDRNKKQLSKIYQYDFPDTANFNGDILELSTRQTDDTEKYSQNVLLLFWPFRTQTDLKYLDSYTLKLR